MTYGLLKGKKGIISGALDPQSIAWKVATLAHAEGAEILLTNAPVAMRLGQIKQLATELKTEVISADATSIEDLNNLFESAEKKFGKVDFVLHAIGMSPNVRKDIPYTQTNYDWFAKTLDVSALSFHKMMRVAFERNSMNDWGSFVALSYIAAQRPFPKYNDMNDAKALLESIARTFGYEFGRKNKVRVNTISQSPTPTTAGTGIEGFESMLKYAEKMSPLGNATADDCARLCLFLFSDLSRRITMQNLFNDGGFSTMGATPEILNS
jgi:enoyl-[acyl-carrier protein] reductase I